VNDNQIYVKCNLKGGIVKLTYKFLITLPISRHTSAVLFGVLSASEKQEHIYIYIYISCLVVRAKTSKVLNAEYSQSLIYCSK
jgi:hypothetical protein